MQIKIKQQSPKNIRAAASLILIAALSALSGVSHAEPPRAADLATINVDAGKETGKVSPYIFGQNLEYEYGTFSGGEQNMHNAHGTHTGGIWAEMLRDRKFEEGDLDKDGVANAWVPEERLNQRYWELKEGRAAKHRYFIDKKEFYGGGASQAIEVQNDRASIAQVALTFEAGRPYQFYVYLKRQGQGTAAVDFEDINGTRFGHQDFAALTGEWVKYTAQFTAPQATVAGRVRISVNGAGTFWIDSASLMPANALRGMRRDVIEAIKPLRVPVVRYPGGCFADTYHWQDGIGPRDKRPERFDTMWNEWEPNDFGPDEFMDFEHEIGAAAQITVNYLMGTPEEAGDWTAYMNGGPQTPMGQLRGQNGHAAPYGVKIWTVGNESQQLCSADYFPASSAKVYAERFKAYASAIKRSDSTAKLMAGGAPPGPLKWNTDLLRAIDVDYLAASLYTRRHEKSDVVDAAGVGQTPVDEYDTRVINPETFYRQVAAEPLEFSNMLDAVINSGGDLLPKNRPVIVVTEFQAWWVSERNDADFRLANALYIGGVFHALMRRADKVAIAEVESLVNVQGVIEVSQTSLKLTPEYYAYLLYRNHTGSRVLSTKTDSAMASFNKTLPLLDSQASLSAEGKTLFLAVINRAEAESLRTQIHIRGWKQAPGAEIKLFELNGSDRDASNPFGSSKNVNIVTKTARQAGLPLELKFPPHSVTIVEFAGSAG